MNAHGGLSEESALEETRHQAERLEKEYEWLKAAESYDKALKLLPEDDFSRKAETLERLGYAFYRAAFQAESNEEFKQRLRQAIEDYEKAKVFYQRLNDPAKTGRIFRCDAMNAYMGYWLASEAPEKKKLLNECWRFTLDSLEALRESGKAQEYGDTFNQLSTSALLEYCYELDYQARKRITKEVVDHGEMGIKLLSTLSAPDELAKIYARTAFALSLFAYYFLDTDEKENCVRKAQGYWTRAKEASEDPARLEMLCPVPCAHDLLWGTGSEEALTYVEKALEHGRRTKDKLIIGSALDWLTYHAGWTITWIDDYDELAKGQGKVLQYAEDARRQYSVTSFTSPRADMTWVEAIHATLMPSYHRETDLGKRHDTLERAVAAGREGLELAETSGYPYAIMYANYELSRNLRLFADIESSPEEKKRLLEEALQHSEMNLRLAEQLMPFAYWDLGVARGNLTRIKWGLADLTMDSETKKSMLQAAMVEIENATKLLVKDVSFQPEKKTAVFANLGTWQYSAGGWWIRLYRLSCDEELLRKAAEAFAEALESFRKVNLISNIAECHWKIAQAYDELDDHLTAAEKFCLASDSFKGAAEKIPQLKGFYQDHACYMQAWGEIEKARHHHERQEYGLAKEHFEKAAELHRPLKRWSYLEPNYSAWARVEDAEDLSRKEQCEEAIKAFEEAVKLFDDTKRSIQNELSKIEDLDEKQMANSMVKATDARREYCEARIAVEEAKILDKKGDHYSSSKKYGSAAETFERISQRQESEQEKREMQFITALSHAWQKMTLAEAEASPALYAEASQVFEQARDYAANEKTKMLVLGHSYFCKALEAGTTFVNTRDLATHDRALQQLASASNYYIKADFQTASEYAKATKLLFDAYLYMDNAERESDPEKKAKLYVMIERVLQTSAGSYTKAEHPEKREQMLKLLEKAKEEQELAASMTEALHAPSIVSATTAFASPTPTKEQAVGSERFEHADVQANLIIRHRELRIGENLSIELELVNAGKGSALLTKVTEIVPKGFEVAGTPETCRVEDSFINLKGKRLDPLKTEEVKLVLRPTLQGTFSLKPTVLYLDENGRYKSHEPEPVTIVVKELGIKGWLKGER
jgi:tetratricopeptide (TPR) repeat protein